MSSEPELPEERNEQIPSAEQVLHITNPEVIEEPATPIEFPTGIDSIELETSFLHPSSLVFTIIAQLRQNLIPAIVAIFGAARGSYWFLGIAAAIFVLSLVAATIRYLTLRYSIHSGELTVQSGLIFRRLRKVPTSQIQNIDLVQNVLHRIFKVAEVRVETASGTEPEATLRVLSLAQVAQLRDRVANATRKGGVESPARVLSAADAVIPTHVPESIQEVLQIPTSWLIKAGLASNRGMVLVGFLIGIYFQNLPDDGRDVQDQIKGLSSYLPDLGEGVQLWASTAAAIVVFLLLIRLLGVGWFILRFFGYQLKLGSEDFKISCGLFTKVSATVPVRRIQFISIHRPILMRWMGLASIRIETAGGAGNNQEDATTSVSKRWFIPVVPEKEICRLMEIIRPDVAWTEDNFDWRPLAPRAAARFIRIGVVFSVLVGVAGVAASRPWGWIPGAALLPLTVWYQLKRSRSTKYARISKGLVFRSGNLYQENEHHILRENSGSFDLAITV